jgi:YesN/AraC family two-component response regulator
MQAYISVADTGCGIPETDRSKVFDRFFVSSYSRSMNKDGSGIGLSLVKSIVEQQGGSVSLVSAENEGTCVTLFFPLRKSCVYPSENNVSPETSELLSNRPLVVLAEDNEELRNFIVQSLSSQYNILTASNGRDALKLILETPPQLVITDILMPQMDGRKFCLLLRDNIETARIPIIVLTAKNDKQTELDMFSTGIEEFIAKPFDVEYLGARMGQLMDKSKRMEEKRITREIIRPQEEIIVSQEEKQLIRFTRLIENSLSDTDLNVGKLSRLSGFSEKQLGRVIKQCTGMSPVEYIRNIRLKKAMIYLKQQKLSISEALYLVGFSSPSYFTKCFKQEYKMTPKEFVEMLKKEGKELSVN